jgi:hypothetical protein
MSAGRLAGIPVDPCRSRDRGERDARRGPASKAASKEMVETSPPAPWERRRWDQSGREGLRVRHGPAAAINCRDWSVSTRNHPVLPCTTRASLDSAADRPWWVQLLPYIEATFPGVLPRRNGRCGGIFFRPGSAGPEWPLMAPNRKVLRHLATVGDTWRCSGRASGPHERDLRFFTPRPCSDKLAAPVFPLSPASYTCVSRFSDRAMWGW